MTDYIHLRNIQLPFALYVVPDPWRRYDKPQPATISVRVSYPSKLISRAAEADTVTRTLDYGKLYRKIAADLRERYGTPVSPSDFMAPEDYEKALGLTENVPATIARASFEVVLETLSSADLTDEDRNAFGRERLTAEVWLHLPKAILPADDGLKQRSVYETTFQQQTPLRWIDKEHHLEIGRIRCFCIIGINPHERTSKQAVLVTISSPFEIRPDHEGFPQLIDVYHSIPESVARVRFSPPFHRPVPLHAPFSLFRRPTTCSV
jgi:dihydroneopterin aldolase